MERKYCKCDQSGKVLPEVVTPNTTEFTQGRNINQCGKAFVGSYTLCTR